VSFGAFALALLLVVPAQSGPASIAQRPAPSRPGLSWDDADALAVAFEQVENRFKAGKPSRKEPLVVSEGQVNSYLNLTLGPKIPPGVTDLAVQLNGEALVVRAKVDLDRVPLKRPTDSGFSLLSLVTGVVPVELAGRLQSQEGQGTIQLTEARLSGISVPIALVAQLVSTSTRGPSLPQGFDINAPFRLPYAMKRVRFELGKAVVDFLQ
jgi:hypothetical protein